MFFSTNSILIFTTVVVTTANGSSYPGNCKTVTDSSVDPDCWKEIQYGISVAGTSNGLIWYPGLSKESSPVEFQYRLNTALGKCPGPCVSCVSKEYEFPGTSMPGKSAVFGSFQSLRSVPDQPNAAVFKGDTVEVITDSSHSSFHDFQIVTDKSTSAKSLSVAAKVEGGYGPVTGSISTEFFTSKVMTSKQASVDISLGKMFGWQNLNVNKVKLSETAKEMLKTAEGVDRFIKLYGRYIVLGYQPGCAAIGRVTESTSSEANVQSMGVKLKVKVEAKAKVGATGSFDSTDRSSSSEENVGASFRAFGFGYGVTLSSSIDDVKVLAQALGDEKKCNFKTAKTLKIKVGSWTNIQDFNKHVNASALYRFRCFAPDQGLLREYAQSKFHYDVLFKKLHSCNSDLATCLGVQRVTSCFKKSFKASFTSLSGKLNDISNEFIRDDDDYSTLPKLADFVKKLDEVRTGLDKSLKSPEEALYTLRWTKMNDFDENFHFSTGSNLISGMLSDFIMKYQDRVWFVDQLSISLDPAVDEKTCRYKPFSGAEYQDHSVEIQDNSFAFAGFSSQHIGSVDRNWQVRECKLSTLFEYYGPEVHLSYTDQHYRFKRQCPPGYVITKLKSTKSYKFHLGFSHYDRSWTITCRAIRFASNKTPIKQDPSYQRPTKNLWSGCYRDEQCEGNRNWCMEAYCRNLGPYYFQD
eukprot:Pgem_evm1s8954